MRRGTVSAIRGDLDGSTILVAPTSPVRQSIVIHQIEIANTGSADISIDVTSQVNNAAWSAFTHVAGVEGADITSDIQGAAAFVLDTSSDENGFFFTGAAPITSLQLNVDVVSDVEFEYEYWNGTDWVVFAPNKALDLNSVGLSNLTLSAPADWTVGGTGVSTNTSEYVLKVTPKAVASSPSVSGSLEITVLDTLPKVCAGSAANKTQYVNSDGLRIAPGSALVIVPSAGATGSFYIEYSQIT